MTAHPSHREFRHPLADPLLLGLGVVTIATLTASAAIALGGLFGSTLQTTSPDSLALMRLISGTVLRVSAAASLALATAILLKGAQFSGRGWLVAMLLASSTALLLVGYLEPQASTHGISDHLRRALQGVGASAVGVVGVSAALFAKAFPRSHDPQNLIRLLSSGQPGRWPHRPVGSRYARAIAWTLGHGKTTLAISASILFVTGYGFYPQLKVLLVAAWILPGMWSLQILFAKYHHPTSSELDRRSALWVVLGFAVGFWLWYVAAGLTTVLLPKAIRASWNLAVLAAGQATMLVCLYVATFWAGSFDPGLTIRKATVYSISSMSVVFATALIEEAVSNLLVSRLGLPSGWSIWIVVGLVAVAISLLHRRYGAALKRALDWVASRTG